MAFSTQKIFFHLPFDNEEIEFECDKACVKLKTYPSSHDSRAWAASDSKKSRFLTDLVACNTFTIRPEEKPDKKKKKSSAKKPMASDNKRGGNKRTGNQSNKPNQRRRGEDDYCNEGKQDQMMDARLDTGSRGGLGQRRTSFGRLSQSDQSPTSRRYLGPHQFGQGSPVRKGRAFTKSDDESHVRGGRGELGTSQHPYIRRSPSQNPGGYNQPIEEYPTEYERGNDRYGSENPYVDQEPTSSKGVGQVGQGNDFYNDPTYTDTDMRGDNGDQSPEPIQEQIKYDYQRNVEQGDAENSEYEYERYQNYESDCGTPKGYVYNSQIQEDGCENYARTHLTRYEPSYHGNRSGNWRSQDFYGRSHDRSQGRYHMVPHHIHLQRQHAYERLCAFAAGHRRNYYSHI